jgi:tellurite resistance protein TerC
MIDTIEHLPVSIGTWIIFNLFILTILVLDLVRFYRNPHVVSVKEACWTSLGWVSLAFTFNMWIYFQYGVDPALKFLTGYLLEESLSVDNLFVFLLIFKHFKVPAESKHNVLFYGILGAVIMRGLLIWAGIALTQTFSWIFIVFGLFLVVTGVKLAFQKESDQKIEEGFFYRFLTRWLPFDSTDKSGSFIVKKEGQWQATPLFLVLILIELTDLIFALDSVPAILGITTDPFIVYTSNIFAILGLRSLFFALEGLMNRFYLLHYALAFILVFIGVKMIFAAYFHIPILVTLAIITGSLIISLIVSYLYPQNKDITNY